MAPMRAVAFTTFGGPEVLQVTDIPTPEPGPGEVRVRVAAATVNPTDIGMRNGTRKAILEKLPAPWVAGMEIAGTIDAVGPDSGWQVGERAMAIVLPTVTGRGAQSEQVVVPAASAVRVPEKITLEEAATIPMNGLTAVRALDLLDLKPGQTLVISGAAGAVGAYVVELGAAKGLKVIAIASPSDETFLRGIGAEHLVPRGHDAPHAVRALVPEGVDGALDAGLIGPSLLAAVRDGGGFAVIRGFEGETERGITVHRVSVSDYARNTAALDNLGQLAASGKLALRVAETFPPERAGEAQAKLVAGGVRGRLLITF